MIHDLHALQCMIAVLAMEVSFPCRAVEYEVKGKIHEIITDYNAPEQDYTNDFTVYVRDCSWLIQTTESDAKGNEWKREVGSSNGKEIYEANAGQAFISDNGIPVELLDMGMDGHLWLMFASRCYWGSLHDDQLTPIYDWHASIGANPNLKVTAEWNLLNGPGSLPREVVYLGEWGETNGLYRITGTTNVGEMLISTGFIFEERFVGPLAPNSFVHEMTLRKRVEAEVTSVSAVCSRKDLVPARASKRTVIVDWRLPALDNHIPSYIISDTQKWPSIEEATKIAGPIILGNAQKPVEPTPQKRAMVLWLLCFSVLLGPIVMLYNWSKSRKSPVGK